VKDIVKLSIVTINLNNAEGLQNTIDSVFHQTYTAFEYIVIDGGSTDSSKEIIQKNAHRFNYSVSEKDNGIYQAMNKGILKASGEYIMFLNSGDLFYNEDVLNQMIASLDGEDILYGDLMRIKNEIKEPCIFPDVLSFEFFITGFNSLPHAGTLIKRSVFKTVGLYNESFKIVSDWEFFILAINKYNCTFKHLATFVVIFNLEGISAQKEFYPVIQKERRQVLDTHFKAFLSDYDKAEVLQKELNVIKKMLGFRIHNKLSKIVAKIIS
jgi:glycosyltransferase involved in cell wall biosynthesis